MRIRASLLAYLLVVIVPLVLGCSPTIIDNYSPPNRGTQFVVTPDGNYAFVVMESNKLLVLDTSNPSDIKRAALFKVDSTSETLQSLALSQNGQVLYIGTTDGIRALDVSNPQQPENLQTNIKTEASQIVLCNTETHLYVVASSSLKVFNLTGYSMLDSVNCDGKATVTVAHDNAYIYVSDDSNGLKVFQRQNKLSLVSRVRSRTGEDSKHSYASTNGMTLYAAFSNEGVQVLNVADPKNPKKTRTLLPSSGKAKYVTLFESASLAFVALGPSVGVGIYNLSSEGDQSPISTLSFNHEDVQQISIHPDSDIKKKKLMFVLTTDRFSIVDFSSCISSTTTTTTAASTTAKPSSTTTTTTTTTTSITTATTTTTTTDETHSSTTSTPSLTTGEGSGMIPITTEVIISGGSPSEDDGSSDAGSAIVAIAVIGSVAFVGVAIYVSLYMIKKRRWNNFEKEYRSVDAVPLEEINS